MNNNLHQLLVNALIVKDGYILISQRSFKEEHEPGKWTIPGGKVEQTKGNIWDVLEFNVKKEVMEEIGVEIEDNINLVCNNTFVKANGTHVVVMTFLCNWKDGEAKALEDTIDVKWVKEKDIDNYRFPPNVKDYLIKGFKEI